MKAIIVISLYLEKIKLQNVCLIIIIIVIFKCYYPREHIALSLRKTV